MPTYLHVTKITTCKTDTGPKWLTTSSWDWFSRATVVLVLTLFMLGNVVGALQGVVHLGSLPIGHSLLHILTRGTTVLFLALAAATAITRLRPVCKAPGIEPRLSALLGSFLMTTLAVVPRPELHPLAIAASSVLVIVGMVLSFLVLRWLGKSFSIMAEARSLVTNGPYKLVRHPLYLCEELAVLGMFIQVISPLALIIVLVHALIQFRRMLNEEKVLHATFPDYKSYSACTSRLIPRFNSMSCSRAIEVERLISRV